MMYIPTPTMRPGFWIIGEPHEKQVKLLTRRQPSHGQATLINSLAPIAIIALTGLIYLICLNVYETNSSSGVAAIAIITGVAGMAIFLVLMAWAFKDSSARQFREKVLMSEVSNIVHPVAFAYRALNLSTWPDELRQANKALIDQYFMRVQPLSSYRSFETGRTAINKHRCQLTAIALARQLLMQLGVATDHLTQLNEEVINSFVGVESMQHERVEHETQILKEIREVIQQRHI